MKRILIALGSLLLIASTSQSASSQDSVREPAVAFFQVVEPESLTAMQLKDLPKERIIELRFTITPTGPLFEWFREGNELMVKDTIRFVFGGKNKIRFMFTEDGSVADAAFGELFWKSYPYAMPGTTLPHTKWKKEKFPKGTKPNKQFVMTDEGVRPGEYKFGFTILSNGATFVADPTIVDDPGKKPEH